MTMLAPEPPFLWPEVRVLTGLTAYAEQPPFRRLAMNAHVLFGIVPALTARGVEVIRSWLLDNGALKVRIIVVAYPTCPTRQPDLMELARLSEAERGRLSARIYALPEVADRTMSVLCFFRDDGGHGLAHMVAGSTENLGVDVPAPWHVNLAFEADRTLLEAFRRQFDWLWFEACDITAIGATQIPHLVLPRGSEEAARQWQAYRRRLRQEASDASDDGQARIVVQVERASGEVSLYDRQGAPLPSPTDELGVPELDPLAERIARLYRKGRLVTVDKLSRIPPLDAPLKPEILGEPPELEIGAVRRRVSLRVSIIDESILKEIEKRRQGLRALLTKFTFGLADGTRWMPDAACGLFEAEIRRLDEEGRKLISDLLKGDAKGFVAKRMEKLKDNLNALYQWLGRQGKISDAVLEKVASALEQRLEKAQLQRFMPTLSFSRISFMGGGEGEGFASPWGQAYSLLSDILRYPRAALTDAYFFRGLTVPRDDLLEAMNVADDHILRLPRPREIFDTCRQELQLLSQIESDVSDPRRRCELACMILDGCQHSEIMASIHKSSQ